MEEGESSLFNHYLVEGLIFRLSVRIPAFCEVQKDANEVGRLLIEEKTFVTLLLFFLTEKLSLEYREWGSRQLIWCEWSSHHGNGTWIVPVLRSEMKVQCRRMNNENDFWLAYLHLWGSDHIFFGCGERFCLFSGLKASKSCFSSASLITLLCCFTWVNVLELINSSFAMQM